MSAVTEMIKANILGIYKRFIEIEVQLGDYTIHTSINNFSLKNDCLYKRLVKGEFILVPKTQVLD